MIRTSAWALILLLVAAAVSPVPASGLMAGSGMMPMHTNSQAASPSSGCTCNMPLSAAAAPSPAPSLPRQAGGADPAPCTGSALPTLPATTNVPGRFSGIRRIYAKNVLDHPERAAVHTLIVERPGIDIGGIAGSLAMNRETLRYHLGLLESTVKIVVMRDRGIIRYYENHGRYTLLERKVLQHLWNPTGKAMLAVIATRPGITQSGIAAHLGITAPTVRWYIHRFRADGLITEQHEGKYTRYFLSPEAGGFVPVAMNGRPDLPVPA